MRVIICFIVINSALHIQADTLVRTSLNISKEHLVQDVANSQSDIEVGTDITNHQLTTDALTVERKERRLARQGGNNQSYVMTFTEFLSLGLKLDVCIKLNTKSDKQSSNVATAIGCSLFATSPNLFIKCLDQNQVDRSDPLLDKAILILNISECTGQNKRTEIRVICADRYAAIDFSGEQTPRESKVCLVRGKYLKEIGNETKDQETLQRLAKKVCGHSFERSLWKLTVASSVSQCHGTFIEKTVPESTYHKIVAYTSVAFELVCIGVMWREVLDKNKIMAMLFVTSAADIISLAGILLQLHWQDRGVVGTPCLVSAWMNHFATTVSALVHMQITFNRVVAVVYSMKVRIWCSWKKNVLALGVFAGLGFITSIVISIPRFLDRSFESKCDAAFLKLDIYALTMVLMYYICFVCVPVLMVVVCSVWIIIELIKVNRERRTLSGNIKDIPNAHINLGLLASVVLFLVFVLPLSILDILSSFFGSFLVKHAATLHSLLYVRCSAGCLNFVARLFLVGDFRKRFLEVVKAFCRKLRLSN